MDEFSFKGVKMGSHFSPRFDLIVLCLVRIKIIRRQGILRFPCVTPVVVTFSPDRVAFRIPPNISDGALLRKWPTALTPLLFPQNSPSTDFWQDRKYRSDRRCCENGVWVDCKCMEFVATGWCKKKWLRLYQTMKNKKSYFLWFRKSDWTKQMSWIVFVVWT